MHVLVGGGVFEAEDEGVEGLPGQELEAVHDVLLVLGEGGAFEYLVAAIGGVVEEGMADMAHVGTDLVGAAGLEDAFYEGDIAEALFDAPVGDGVLADLGVVVDGHDAAVFLGAGEIADDGAGVFVEVAPDEGVVFALDGVIEELLGEVGLGLFVLGEEEESGGVFVDTVAEIGLDGLAGLVGLDLIVVGEGVEEGAGIVAVSGMDDEAWLLVDDEDVVVFVDDGEWDVLREYLELVWRLWKEDADLVEGLDAVVGLGGAAVDEDALGLGGCLDLGAGDAFEAHL